MLRLEQRCVYKGPLQATSLSRCDHTLTQKNHGRGAQFTGGADWADYGSATVVASVLFLDAPIWASEGWSSVRVFRVRQDEQFN